MSMNNNIKEELGKWLMDVSKYIATAVILTSVFGEIQQKWIIYIGGLAAIVVTLCWGLFLIRNKKS
jgi:hypothetical protein